MKSPCISLYEMSGKIWQDLPRYFRRLVVRYHEWDGDPHSRTVLYDLFGEDNIKAELEKLFDLFTILKKVEKFSDVNIYGDEIPKVADKMEDVINMIYDVCDIIPNDVDRLTHRDELLATYKLMGFKSYIEVYVISDGTCEAFLIDESNDIEMFESCAYADVGELVNKMLNEYNEWLNG